MDVPVFDQVNIVSGDVDASLAFYRKLGVEIPEHEVWRTAAGGQHVSAIRGTAGEAASLDIDSTAFAQCWNAAWSGRTDLRGRLVIGFRAATRADVDDTYRSMTDAGYRGLQEPYDAFWGARYAIVEDPDGIAVGVMSPISPERKTRPPQP